MGIWHVQYEILSWLLWGPEEIASFVVMKEYDGVNTRLIAAIWIGVIIAGNLIAPTAKFRAPNLDLNVALEIGRVTFRWMLIPEVVLSILMAVLGLGRRLWLPIGILAIQWLAIMPALDARTLSRINGEVIGSSSHHVYFIALEFAKLLTLVWIMGFPEKKIQSAKSIMDESR